MLSVRALSKTFPGQRALDDVSLDIGSGEVCALVGQNGSGKSTLVKILAGYYEADPGGSVTFEGRSSSIHDRQEAHGWRRHVRFVHQDLGLVKTLGTLDNLALGRGFETNRIKRIQWSAEAARARRILAEFDMDIDLDVPVGRLSAVECTMIAIVRALLDFDAEHGMLVLDEPTASLSQPEVARLFTAVRRLADRGAGVMFVSHRIGEVFDLAHRVIVLRDGRVVADRPTSELDHDRVVELIIGRPLDALFPPLPPAQEDVLLRIDGLSGRVLTDLSLSVRAGEVLGVAGLSGSGRDELAALVFGAAERACGDVAVAGVPVVPNVPAAAMAAGIALVPADRAVRGVIAEHSVRENLMLPDLRSIARGRWINRRRERQEAYDWVRRVKLRPPYIDRPVGGLSGGNQQKVVLAKWLRRTPRVLLLDEPTQGVDVGAKAAVYRLIVEAARAGAAVVVCSSDDEELAELSDRVIVLVEGRITAELGASRLTQQSLTAATLRPAAPPIGGPSNAEVLSS